MTCSPGRAPRARPAAFRLLPWLTPRPQPLASDSQDGAEGAEDDNQGRTFRPFPARGAACAGSVHRAGVGSVRRETATTRGSKKWEGDDAPAYYLINVVYIYV